MEAPPTIFAYFSIDTYGFGHPLFRKHVYVEYVSGMSQVRSPVEVFHANAAPSPTASNGLQNPRIRLCLAIGEPAYESLS